MKTLISLWLAIQLLSPNRGATQEPSEPAAPATPAPALPNLEDALLKLLQQWIERRRQQTQTHEAIQQLVAQVTK